MMSTRSLKSSLTLTIKTKKYPQDLSQLKNLLFKIKIKTSVSKMKLCQSQSE